MAWFAIATAVVSTAVGIHGQRQAAKAQEQAAEWNADQMRKQAAYEESLAQKNMRRERENNRRELARRRASSARGGLAETGAVADNLIEASERHQQEIDDIWERASTVAQTHRAKANMSIWEGQVAQQAAKTAMWGTAIQGAGQVYGAGAKGGLWGGGGSPTPNPNQTAPLKAVPYNG